MAFQAGAEVQGTLRLLGSYRHLPLRGGASTVDSPGNSVELNVVPAMAVLNFGVEGRRPAWERKVGERLGLSSEIRNLLFREISKRSLSFAYSPIFRWVGRHLSVPVCGKRRMDNIVSATTPVRALRPGQSLLKGWQ